MKLAQIFCDNMVLQRDREICIFGTGKGKGSIEFCGKSVDFISETEEFRVYLPPQPAGGPYDMKIMLDGENILLKNILIGDVYIAAGQSNMEFRLKGSADIEIKECEFVRLFTEPHYNNGRPFNGWQECREDSAMEFSTIGYYFALNMYEHTKVPVGIISCNKGASRVDTWPAPEIVNDEEYQKLMPEKLIDYHCCAFNQDSCLYINKLLPIVPYTVSGVLWYQGESNRLHAEAVNYCALLNKMIENWRELWDFKLPFYSVQLMPYEDAEPKNDWAAVREEQEKAAKRIDKVYMVTLFNTGEAKLIHPTRKKEVAKALSNAVLCEKFEENLEYSGPLKDNVEKIENGVKISFAHANGLKICGKYLEDTYVYDKDNTPYTVAATVDKNVLILKWDAKIVPVRVSMGYENAPKHNLYNSDGYLASPFNICL